MLKDKEVPELKGFEDEGEKLRLPKSQLEQPARKSPSPRMNI